MERTVCQFLTTSNDNLIRLFFNRPENSGRFDPEFIASCKSIGIVRNVLFPYQYNTVCETTHERAWLGSVLGWDDIERWAIEHNFSCDYAPISLFDWTEYTRYKTARTIPYDFNITDPTLLQDFFDTVHPKRVLSKEKVADPSIYPVVVGRTSLDKANVYYRAKIDGQQYVLSYREDWYICYRWALLRNITVSRETDYVARTRRL